MLRPFADTVTPRTAAGPGATALGVLHQVLLTVLGSTAGLMAVILLTTDGGPVVTGSTALLHLIGHTLLMIAAILGLRVLALVFRRPRDSGSREGARRAGAPPGVRARPRSRPADDEHASGGLVHPRADGAKAAVRGRLCTS